MAGAAPLGGGDPVRVTCDEAAGAPTILLGQSLWTWDYGYEARPSHVFAVPLSEAGLPAGTRVAEVTVSWTAGGLGSDGDTARRGVRLLVWDAGRWSEVGGNEARGDEPAVLEWSTQDPLHSSYWPCGATKSSGVMRRAGRRVVQCPTGS